MNFWRIGRIRRWPVLAVLGLGGMIATIVWGAESVVIPSADGPRFIRQLVISLLPCLVAPVLVDQLPTVSATLVRNARLALLERVASLLVVFGVGALAWTRLPDLFPGAGWYEAAVIALLMAIALAGTARWGVGGVLGTCVAAIVWLLAGDTLADLMGFDTLLFPGAPPRPSARAVSSVTCSFVALAVAAFLSSRPRWRAADPGR